jgi:hypothetical protein
MARGKPAYYLFDHASDPFEQHDVLSLHPEVARKMRGKLDKMIEASKIHAEKSPTSQHQEISPRELESLRALGYLDDRPDS